MRTRLTTAAAGLVWLLLRASAGAQERVDVDFPSGATFPVDLGAGTVAVSGPTLLRFRHALLSPGGRLRFSVRAEGEGVLAGCGVTFSAHSMRGIARGGVLSATDFLPVFESAPSAVSGSAEITWTLRCRSAIRRAGPHTLTLRWKVESVPASAWASPGLPGPPRTEWAPPLPETGPRPSGADGRKPRRIPPSLPRITP
jgi:hypothetical protein